MELLALCFFVGTKSLISNSNLRWISGPTHGFGNLQLFCVASDARRETVELCCCSMASIAFTSNFTNRNDRPRVQVGACKGDRLLLSIWLECRIEVCYIHTQSLRLDHGVVQSFSNSHGSKSSVLSYEERIRPNLRYSNIGITISLCRLPMQP